MHVESILKLKQHGVKLVKFTPLRSLKRISLTQVHIVIVLHPVSENFTHMDPNDNLLRNDNSA